MCYIMIVQDLLLVFECGAAEVQKMFVTVLFKRTHIATVIKQEIIDGMNYCFTGRVTRLVNSLTGFIDGINIGISENEQINNAVIAAIRRCEKDKNLNIVQEVTKILDELNITDKEQRNIWLDAV